MNLLPKTNSHSGCEDDMQREVAEVFHKQEFYVGAQFTGSYVTPKVYREITIPEIGRRSDVIVQVTPRKIFNIECKIVDANGVLSQAIDHLLWADYSYICLHDRAYIPTYIVRNMLKHGIGLLLWREGALTEAFGADYNKSKDKKLRERVMKRLREIDRENTAKNHIQKKLGL